MDQRIIDLLKAIAFEYIEHDEDGTHCVFCGGDEILEPMCDRISHDTDCQTTRARAILNDLNMPLSLYKVAYELLREHVWRAHAQFFPAFSVQSVYDSFKPTKARRNVQIEKERELR